MTCATCPQHQPNGDCARLTPSLTRRLQLGLLAVQDPWWRTPEDGTCWYHPLDVGEGRG